MSRALPYYGGRRSLVPVALLVAAALATPAAAADVTVPATEAPARALKLSTTRAVTATLTLPGAAKAITVRARGIACGGAPTLRVAVDGGRPVAKTLRGSREQDLTVATGLAAGTHRVTVALTKAYKNRNCRRAIVVDRIRTTAVAASAPASTASLPFAAPPSRVPEASAPAPQPGPAAPTTPAEATPLATTETTPDAPTPTVTTPTTTTPTTTTPTTTTPTTTTPTTTTPAPPAEPAAPVEAAPSPPARPKLHWAPPALTAPTTITVAQGDQSYALNKTKDYIIDLGPTTHYGTVKLDGGRNVVIIGGRIALTALAATPLGLNIKNSTGVVHVEGVEFDGSSGREMDAIQIQAPDAIVQVENVRADNLLGTYDTNHSDVIQPWGGVGQLRVDRLTADSNYQGIFTRPDQGAIGAVDLRHVNLSFNDAAATSSGGFLLWMTTGCTMAPTALSEVYIRPRAGKTVGAAVWPPTTDASCPAKLTANKVTWPNLPVTGAVTGGTPAAGAYVPEGAAGPGYVSPGYE